MSNKTKYDLKNVEFGEKLPVSIAPFFFATFSLGLADMSYLVLHTIQVK
jgi:hypothetical protein